MNQEGEWIKDDADKLASEKGNDKASNVVKSHKFVRCLF